MKSESQQTLAFVSKERGKTPLMRQYYRIKDEHPGAILLFRMGDFYETFGEDAQKVAPVLGITLTRRANGKAADIPLAGFPHHSLDAYLPKLIRAGYRVAICEQLEDASKSGKLVKRDVVEVVSPGVVLRDQLLEPKKSHYLSSVVQDVSERVGIAFVDASTGEFFVAETAEDQYRDMLASVNPAEIIHARSDSLDLPADTVKTSLDDWVYSRDYSTEVLLDHFGTHSLKGFGVNDMPLGLVAAGAVVHYLNESQPHLAGQIRKLSRFELSTTMWLDEQTRRNLELISSNSPTGEGSLISLLDETETSMGARKLRSWILRPLRDLNLIHARHEAVEDLIDDSEGRSNISENLQRIGDLERLAGKVTTLRASPRDLDGLMTSLVAVGELKQQPLQSERLRTLLDRLTVCTSIIDAIKDTIRRDPPVGIANGGIIRPGVSAELDEVRSIAQGGKSWIAEMQTSEAKRTGISSLKVGYNKVFGYYLEVTNAHKQKVPDEYIRKQTLVNAERYITPELKQYEEKVLSAQERIAVLERKLFEDLRESLVPLMLEVLDNGSVVAEIDCLVSFASVALKRKYVRPTMTDDRTVEIIEGRHPVVEEFLPEGDAFVPNSVKLDPETNQILVITGPNMAGKSVFLRQAGLIVLLAQVGSFVPAKAARIGVVDRIFTRVGASDNVSQGESTFLVEMNETANILNNATPDSLILLDEVGRGTSTFDGLSIAWSLIEYLHNTESVRAKTLFATHYHELNSLSAKLSRVKNYRVLVKEHDGRVIFVRKVVPGGADHSYGIEVAKMAGLPKPVIHRANEVLKSLESHDLSVDKNPSTKPPRRKIQVPEYLGRLARLDINNITPVQALAELNKILEEIDTTDD